MLLCCCEGVVLLLTLGTKEGDMEGEKESCCTELVSFVLPEMSVSLVKVVVVSVSVTFINGMVKLINGSLDDGEGVDEGVVVGLDKGVSTESSSSVVVVVVVVVEDEGRGVTVGEGEIAEIVGSGDNDDEIVGSGETVVTPSSFEVAVPVVAAGAGDLLVVVVVGGGVMTIGILLLLMLLLLGAVLTTTNGAPPVPAPCADTC
jgi:hypothetical protein